MKYYFFYFFIFLFFFQKLSGQPLVIAVYEKEKNGLADTSETLYLLKEHSRFYFQFINQEQVEYSTIKQQTIDNNDSIVLVGERDTSVLWPKIVSPLKISLFGPYEFKNENNSLQIGYLNSKLKTIWHEQYSYDKSSTTKCLNLFYKGATGYSVVDGTAKLLTEAILLIDGKKHSCFVFLEKHTVYATDDKSYQRKVFIDKKNILPLKIEYLYGENVVSYTAKHIY